ncbi:MAG: ATP-binding protein [Saprospiraceae bacterium]
MRIFLLLIVCQMPCFLVRAQEVAYVDSLRRVYQAEPDSKKKIDVFYRIAIENAYGNPELGYRYADSLETMATQADYLKGHAMALHIRANACLDASKPEDALELYRKELQIFIRLQDRREQSSAISNMGNAWSDMGRSDSAIVYYQESIRMDEQMGGDPFPMTINHNNIGQIYSDNNVFDKAIQHFQLALQIRQKLGLEKKLIPCYVNLASVYGRMKDLPRSEEYTRLGLDLALKYNSFNQAGMLCNNLGNSYMDFNRYPEAISWLEKAKTYFEKAGNRSHLTYPIVNLSSAYAKTGDPTRALDLAKEGYAIVEDMQLDGVRELYYRAFAEAYEKLNQPGLAYTWYKKYVTVADSVFKQDNTRKVAEVEAQYQTEKQKAQIAQNQVQIQNQRLLLFGALAAILTLIVFFQFVRNRQKIRQKELDINLQLEQAEASRLRELDQVKSSFFANISHEFRTPLTLILGPVQKWLRDAAGQPEVTIPGKELNGIRRNAARLLDLVNQLLDLSKIESGRMRLSVSRDDLAQTLRVLGNAFDSMAEQNNIRYRIELPAESALAWFDRDKLEKIASNLLSNAFKHTPASGEVIFRANIRDDRLTLSVSDNGKGIAPEDLDKIFERFYQVESAGDKGTGIGLALVKELVALHKGNISVESQPGKGSVFQVELPVGWGMFDPEDIVEAAPAAAFVAEKPAAAESSPPVQQTQDASGDNLPLCLIVEDNTELQTFISEQLQSDFRVLIAANGRLGLEAALEHIPDLVISDVMMPEMDGNQFCAALKTDERTSHIPVILLTAKAGLDSRIEGLETGADDYLTKPFDTRELLVRAHNLVAQRERLRKQFSRTMVLKPKEIALTSADERFLQRVQDCLNAHLGDEQFNVEELAAQTGMSRSQLHRKLTALIDQPPVEFIRNFRLQRAREMLEAGTGNVSEICYDVGFNSPAYFSKAFKDAFGISPSEVRKP